MKREVKRTSIASGVLLLATLAFVHWPPIPPSPQALLNLPMTTFGPYETAANDGYESSSEVSPVVPASYRALAGPQVVGLQFVGDSNAALKADKFVISLNGGPYHDAAHAPNVYRAGFVGWKLPSPLPPGRYHVRVDLTGFNTPGPSWSITVSRPAAALPTETAAARQLMDALNTVRSPLRLAVVGWSPSLQAASAAHARYLGDNGYNAPSFHMESAKRPDYTGKTPWNRDMSFGWPTPVSGEVGMEWARPTSAVTVIQDLADTVYHRLLLFSGNLIAAGEGESTGNHGAVVMDLGFGYRATLPFATVYPYDGQPGVPTGWVDIESPDPVRDGYGRSFGYPVTADFPTVTRLSAVRVRMNVGNRRVSLIIDPPAVGDMGDNQIGLVPKYMLKPDAYYTVHLRAQAVFADGSRRPIAVAWSFGTGASDQSVAALVQSGHRVIISDVVAGSGNPEPYQAMTLYRRTAGKPLTRVETGETNDEGLWTVTRQSMRPGYYEAVSSTQNAAVFWWGAHGTS